MNQRDDLTLTPEAEKRILDEAERACRHEKAQRKALIAAHAAISAAVWAVANDDMAKWLERVRDEVEAVL